MPKKKRKSGTGSRPPARPAAAAAASPGKSRRGWLLVALAALAVLAVIAVASQRDSGGNKGSTDDTTTATNDPNVHCTTDSRMDTYSTKGSGVVHTDAPGYDGPLSPHDNPRYTVNPPSGGDHLSRAVPPGIYEGDRVPPDGNLVHSLEHGYVIVWYKPDLPAEDKAVLRQVFNDIPRDTLLVERANMDTPVAATAWDKRLLCDGVDKARLEAFIKANRNQAPEKIPH
jgi:hypothetical protein